MDIPVSSLGFALMAMAVVLLPLSGAFCALLPFLMPKRERFAVTVPDEARSDPVLRGYERAYASIMVALTVVLTAACALSFALGSQSAGLAFMGIGVLVLSIASYALMLFFRSKVIRLKAVRGWQASGRRAVAMVGEKSMPRALSQKWDLFFLPGMLISLAICLVGYDRIPEAIPGSIGLDGRVIAYYPKSIAMACVPALVVAFVDAFLVFGHWQIIRSKKGSDPALPAASAWAYGRFANVQSKLMVAAGVVLGFVGVAMALSFTGVISLGLAALVCLACVMLVAGGSIVVAAVYGQNGSRLIARVHADGRMPVDDDRFWKAGIFYCNPDDPSLFLPERFGVGWTMNWARPGAWAVLGILVAAIVAFVAAMILVAG